MFLGGLGAPLLYKIFKVLGGNSCFLEPLQTPLAAEDTGLFFFSAEIPLSEDSVGRNCPGGGSACESSPKKYGNSRQAGENAVYETARNTLPAVFCLGGAVAAAGCIF